jgi:hypothetical protein
MQHIAASISNEISPQEAGGWWVLRQLSPALVGSIDKCDGLDKTLRDISALGDELESLIDYVGESIIDATDVESADPDDDKARIQTDQIELKAWEISRHLLEEFSKHRMLIVPLLAGDLVSVREKVIDLASSDTNHELEVILNQLPRHFTERFINQFRKVLNSGSSLRFTLCPSLVDGDQKTESLARLIKQIGNEDVVVQRSNIEIPSGLVLDGRTIVMGWGNWLETATRETNQFGFLVESEKLATQIRSFRST